VPYQSKTRIIAHWTTYGDITIDHLTTVGESDNWVLIDILASCGAVGATDTLVSISVQSIVPTPNNSWPSFIDDVSVLSYSPGWDIQFDGVEVKGKVMSILDELNGQYQAVVRIANDSANRTLVATDHDAVIRFKYAIVFEGRFTAPSYTLQYIDCLCYDKVSEVMGRNIFTGSYDGVLASTILTAICSVAGITASIACGYDKAISVRFDKTTCWDAAKAVAGFVAGDFWTTLGTTFNVGSRGTARSAVTVISWSTRAVDRSKNFNHVYIRGTDVSGKALVGEATAGSGDRYIAFTERKAMNQDTLNNEAVAKLAEINTDSCGVTIVIKITDGYLFGAGDTVPLSFDKLALSGTYVIWRVTKKIDEADLDVDRMMPWLDKVLKTSASSEDYGIYSVQPRSSYGWNSDIKLTRNGSDPIYSVDANGPTTPSDGTITFADGTTLTIDLTPTNTMTFAIGTSWIYWLYPLGEVQKTAMGHPEQAVGTDRAILAKVTVDGVNPLVIVAIGASG
jgi:hypothetical protein